MGARWVGGNRLTRADWTQKGPVGRGLTHGLGVGVLVSVW